MNYFRNQPQQETVQSIFKCFNRKTTVLFRKKQWLTGAETPNLTEGKHGKAQVWPNLRTIDFCE